MNIFRKPFLIKIFLLICLLYYNNLFSIDIEDMGYDPLYSDFLQSLTSGEFYNKYRIPLVFYRQSERDAEYDDFIKYGGVSLNSLIQKEREEEKYFKTKCLVKDFYIYREISNAYISKTLLGWDTCLNFQKKIKQLELEGQRTYISNYKQIEIQRWKKTLLDGLEKIIPLPVPQIIPSEFPPGVVKYAKEYHKLIENVSITNAYLQSNIKIYREDSTHPGISWANSLFDEFNEKFYKEKISSLNLSEQIRIQKIILSNSYISNRLQSLLRDSIMNAFPAKTQILENKMVLQEYKKSTKNMILRMPGMDEEKKS